MTVNAALDWARALGVERLDAALLLAHALASSREWLLAHPDAPVETAVLHRFQNDCRHRAEDVPLAYLVGAREFRGLQLTVNPAVLVPRPDTETLADWAIEVLSAWQMPRPRVLDLGTGSGALALAVAAACPLSEVTATDISQAALAVAADNARQLGLAVRFRHGPWWHAVPGDRFELVVSNPPYIGADDPHLPSLRHEPRQALVAAEGGLAALREIVAQARPHISGWLLLEHGWDQAGAVQRMLMDAGFSDIETRRDLHGQPRCTGGYLS